ncbi:MAG: hypothetical protein LAN63_17395 [Acidobacteriia bacterium]|nr:hypothetical protein [Terriglobia bacterium]
MFHSALKAINTKEIESAISRALSDLAGAKYEVQIKELTFGTSENDQYQDRANMRLFTWRPPEEPKHIEDIVEEFLTKSDSRNVVEISRDKQP